MMIQQPELGKKIASYRKAKGLTQEELVEKCDLNVRTLQRIEAGEVTPRIHTVKLIYTALELDITDSLNPRKEHKKELVILRLEQFYICITDLFNLKTNTMKKISILSTALTLIILGISSISNQINSQSNTTNNDEISKIEKSQGAEPSFYDFSCFGCTQRKGLIIGRDISFKLNGVKVKNVRLMVIDKATREFDALFIKGQFLERKVIAEYPKEWLIDGSLKYSANKIDSFGYKIVLKGNAKVYDLNDTNNPDDDEYIEAKDIIIDLK